MMNTDPIDQFQIGDEVVYVPDGIIARVKGYTWLQSIGGPPRISLYELNIGISVRREHLKRRGVK